MLEKVSFKFLALASFIMLALSFVPSLKAPVPVQRHLSAIDPSTGQPIVIDPWNPISTMWHELYPDHSTLWHLTSWEDSDSDGKLSISDTIDMTNEGTGEVEWFHVDWVSGYLTRHWTWKSPSPPGFDPAEPVSAEPDPDGPPPGANPVGTEWHTIYPQFCRPLTIVAWEDTDGGGDFNPSDQFAIIFSDDGTGPFWAHLDAESTDLAVTSTISPVIPEVPFGTIMGLVSMCVAVAGFVAYKRFRPKFRTLQEL